MSIDLEKLPSYRIGEKRGLEKRMEQGAYVKALAIAAELLKAGMAASQVAAFTQLPLGKLKV